MKIRRRNFKKAAEAQNFWPSFADVMSTVVLVFFFLILLAYIHNIVISSNNKALETSKKNLEAELETRQQTLLSLEEQLDEKRLKISETESQLALKEEALRLKSDELERTQAEVDRGKIELSLSQQQIDEQQQIIAESNQELGNLRTKLQKIAVLRVDILNEVKSTIEQAIGKTNDKGEPLVSIGENANLVINESLMFDTGSSTIKSSGRSLLDQFAKAFEKVLDNDSIRNSIDSINIEGHADITGPSDENRALSSARAYEVVNYLMKSNPRLENKYGKYFAATGYSEFRPIDTGSSAASLQKNRRIEISISIKDSNIQNIINDYLSETDKILESR